MALIRQAEAVRLSDQAISLDLGDLAGQAEAIVSRARAQAEKIIADAKAERAKLIAGAEHVGLQQGQQKGFEQGLKQGAEKGAKQALEEQRARLSAMDQEFAQQLQQFASVREDLLLQARDEVVALALQIAERIVRQHIASNPSVVVEQAATMVRMATGASRLVLRVHVGDVAMLQQALPRLCEAAGFAATTGTQTAQQDDAGHVRIIASEGLSPGSVVLDVAGGGKIDASVDGQIARMAELLLGEGGSGVLRGNALAQNTGEAPANAKADEGGAA
jgi:flagellar biosynthesis/type III secretory pathway protein FliH